MTRHLDSIARLWEAIARLPTSIGWGLPRHLHAHASGEDLSDIVGRLRAITGRIDLVHLNDSGTPRVGR
jgi:deoxyribonuclease-4